MASSAGNSAIPLTPGAVVTFTLLVSDLVPFVQPATRFKCPGFAVHGPSASETLAINVADQAFTFPADFQGSPVTVGTPPTANYSFSVNLNGTPIGSINVNTTGGYTLSTSGARVAVQPGDAITVVGALTPDPTIANVAWTLWGIIN